MGPAAERGKPGCDDGEDLEWKGPGGRESHCFLLSIGVAWAEKEGKGRGLQSGPGHSRKTDYDDSKAMKIC